MCHELPKQAQESAWTEYERFKKDYELSLNSNRKFSDIVKEIMSREGLSIDTL